MTRILYVPKEKLTDIGPQLMPYIASALEYGQGEYSMDDIVDAIVDNRMQLWGAVDDERGILGAAVTCVVVTPQLRILQVKYLGGERMIEWYEALDAELVSFGLRNNCAMVQAAGRAGWARTMPWAGYERQYVVMGKRIDE